VPGKIAAGAVIVLGGAKVSVAGKDLRIPKEDSGDAALAIAA